MKAKKGPMRRCIGCMESKPKKELIRVVLARTSEEGETPEEAVRRELSEELLLSKEQIELQEETSLLVSDSAIIHCFPCRIFNYTGSFSREEVAEVFLAPISFFETTPAKVYTVDWEPVFPSDFPFDKIHGGRNYGWRPRKSRIRFYEYGRRVIWGMTARIIENFVHTTRIQRSS